MEPNDPNDPNWTQQLAEYLRRCSLLPEGEGFQLSDGPLFVNMSGEELTDDERQAIMGFFGEDITGGPWIDELCDMDEELPITGRQGNIVYVDFGPRGGNA